ncbi:uncharacterized protein B0H18DRAFT_986233 [Fomitopsis serialis]|uniref:uncharacterized protein n=1 Tax=Fomitopsis serialis TaxID=139415 RepID=UPI002008707A|nr:uncharacterized protein B0H18DRAFT_986233 [Neoantrodia serialis]KAH9932560.1 hypothetical protein B0H18DRAFT_986233 [Neoantrodia serialis]
MFSKQLLVAALAAVSLAMSASAVPQPQNSNLPCCPAHQFPVSDVGLQTAVQASFQMPNSLSRVLIDVYADGDTVIVA